MPQCHNCNAQILPNSIYCDICGCKIESIESTPPPETVIDSENVQPDTEPESITIEDSVPATDRFLPTAAKKLKASFISSTGSLLNKLPKRQASEPEFAPPVKERKEGGKLLNTLTNIVVGIGVIALCLYMLFKKFASSCLHMLFHK